MSQKMSMADLLAKQDNNFVSLQRGQEIEGKVVAITSQEVILDLGSKSEGFLPKKELGASAANVKAGDLIKVVVIGFENDSGIVLVTTTKNSQRANAGGSPRWDRFETAKSENQTLTGRALEVNKGGLIIEVLGVRGFLPSSQVSLSQASDLEELIGKEIQVVVIEVDPVQNRLIFSHKVSVSEDVKEHIGKLKIGDKVAGKVAAVLPFGIFVSLENGAEGLVHISEIAWEKVEDPSALFKVGDSVETMVTSVDESSGRVNLSIKQLMTDPFTEISKKYTADDVVKGTVTKTSHMGTYVSLEGGAEGLIPTSKIESGTAYETGQQIQVIIDSIDTHKRRILLTPFITTTKGLIYK